jgi:hypothetical protein
MPTIAYKKLKAHKRYIHGQSFPQSNNSMTDPDIDQEEDPAVDTDTTRKRTREEASSSPLAFTGVAAKAPKKVASQAAVDNVVGDDSDSDDDSDNNSEDGSSNINPLIREAETMLEVPKNGGTYTFHLQLLAFNEGLPGVREVSVKLYFDKAEEDKKLAAAAINKDDNEDNDSDNDDNAAGEEVGYLTGFLLPRPAAATEDPVEDSPNFCDMAQAVSDELAEVATLLCNSQGHVTQLRDPGRPTNSPGTPPSFLTKGGFLQIYALETKGPGHAGTCDLGLHLVAQTLEFLQDEWSLAVMVPCLLGVEGMRWPAYHNRLKIDPSAPSHTAEQTEGLKSAHVAIKRHFSRLGFRQVGRNSEQHHVFYLPASDFVVLPPSWKTKEEIQSLDIFVAPDPYAPTGVNATLHELLQDHDPSEPLDLNAIRKLLLEQGASLHGSRSLFLAAAQDSVPWMEDLLDVAGGGTGEQQRTVVNESDENGNTPLHVAAMMMHLDVIQYLLGKGASKRVRNDKQHTPYDTLQESIESIWGEGEGEDHDEDDGSAARGLAKRCKALLKE